MPTIGSEEEGPSGSEYGGESDMASLHADSFVTASDSLHERSSFYDAVPYADRDSKPEFLTPTTSGRSASRPTSSADPPRSPPSASESFIHRHWGRLRLLIHRPSHLRNQTQPPVPHTRLLGLLARLPLPPPLAGGRVAFYQLW